MAGWNSNNSAQVQAFKDYQAIPDHVFDTMSDFEDFIVNKWDDTDLTDTDGKLFVQMFQKVIAKFLMQDEKSQALIKAGEQELLAKWSK